jgi:Pyridoxamine 5'-phosphate oxidase
MVITNQHQQAGLGTAGQEVPHPAAGDDARPMAARLTTEQVWHQVAKASFAVLGYVTPVGEPRSSGVVYKTVGRRLYVAVAPDSWKAKHIAASRRVAVTVPVRRGGLLSLVAPIPPATISFHAQAIVHRGGAPQVRPLLKELGSLLPAERRASACVIEILPEGTFLTYGLDVSLSKLRDPAAARARVPVTHEART